MRLLVRKHTALAKEVNKLLILRIIGMSYLQKVQFPDSTGGLEYTDTPGDVQMIINMKSPNARHSAYTIPPSDIAQLWDNKIDKMTSVNEQHNHNQTKLESTKQISEQKDLFNGMEVEVPTKRIKIGFISSDFGVHPIATLTRGLIQFIDPSKVELYCFAINDKASLRDAYIVG